MNTSLNINKISLFKTALPLIFGWIASISMMLIDRLILSWYSLEALSAIINSGIIVWGFAYGFQVFTEMAQVIVARYKGANAFQQITNPCWQMIWITLCSILFFLPLSMWGYKLFFPPGSMQAIYFKTLLLFGPIFGLIGSTSAYFIGQCQNKIVTFSSLTGNIVNVSLDWIFVFGIKNIIEPMGIKGAALATGIGMTTQAAILLFFFLKCTHFDIKMFDWKETKLCLVTATPPALSTAIELIGSGLFFSIMAKASELHLIIISICHSLIPLLASVGAGLQKTVATYTGLLIGSNQLKKIPKLLKDCIFILAFYFIGLLIAFYFYPQVFITLFSGVPLSSNAQLPLSLYKTIEMGILLSCAHLFFAGIRGLVAGVLSAAEDLSFLFIAGMGSVWILLLIPSYYIVVKLNGGVIAAQITYMIYGFTAGLLYLARYFWGHWQTKIPTLNFAKS